MLVLTPFGGVSTSKEFPHVDLKDIGQMDEFEVADPPSLAFDPRDDVAAHVPFGPLAAGGEIGLRKAERRADFTERGATEIQFTGRRHDRGNTHMTLGTLGAS